MRRPQRSEDPARKSPACWRRFSFADLGQRLPSQLSGGQQQRIALARCMVYQPPIILMDEPLGALDKKLRQQLQLEIRRLHQNLGITVLYVTHDQEEALAMSDRICLMNSRAHRADRHAERPLLSAEIDVRGRLPWRIQLCSRPALISRTERLAELQAMTGAPIKATLDQDLAPGCKVKFMVRPGEPQSPRAGRAGGQPAEGKTPRRDPAWADHEVLRNAVRRQRRLGFAIDAAGPTRPAFRR